MTSLKKSGLLRTYYRDRLRGYRLGAKAKAALLDGWPERFSSYLTGDTDTNRLKSEVNRRLRLHRLAETYVTMDNAGIGLFQDEKPKVFSPQGYHGEAIEYPAFYSSREVKEMGDRHHADSQLPVYGGASGAHRHFCHLQQRRSPDEMALQV